MNALSLAKRLNFCPDEIIKNAVLAYLHWNPKLSTVGKDVLNYFLGQDTFNKTISDYVGRNTWTDQEKKQLGQLHWTIE
jgi:hypothetical protein